MKMFFDPPVDLELGLSEAMRRRRTCRSFSGEPLDRSELACVLWACCGISDESGHRTVPTTRNLQAVSVYVLDVAGVWKYDEREHSLELVKEGDVRASSSEGQKEFVSKAPATLVFVCDLKKAEEARATGPYVDAGCMVQNAYLAACAMGMACVARASFDPDSLASAMGLGEDKRPVLTFTMGRPHQD